MKMSPTSVSSQYFRAYTPPNEGAGLITVDRDLCWRINPRGLVTPAVIGAICWAHNNFTIPAAQHQAILQGLGLEYHQQPGGATILRPQQRYRNPSTVGKKSAEPFNLTTPQLPLHHYDAIEVYGCVEGEGGIERFEANEHQDTVKPHFWSVALHVEIGHVETIADFPTEPPAAAFGEVMRQILNLARQAQGLAISHLLSH
ncbi:MAG: hypothetical protein V4573_09525 [Pseudomonadota bacterium]